MCVCVVFKWFLDVFSILMAFMLAFSGFDGFFGELSRFFEVFRSAQEACFGNFKRILKPPRGIS